MAVPPCIPSSQQIVHQNRASPCAFRQARWWERVSKHHQQLATRSFPVRVAWFWHLRVTVARGFTATANVQQNYLYRPAFRPLSRSYAKNGVSPRSNYQHVVRMLFQAPPKPRKQIFPVYLHFWVCAHQGVCGSTATAVPNITAYTTPCIASS